MLDKISIHGMTVYTVENHHEVLIPWGMERAKRAFAPMVLTLDHHTDTLDAFTHAQETGIVSKDYFEDDIEKALTHLRHDEHFDYAVKRGLIKGAILLTHENFSLPHNPVVEIIHTPPEDSREARERYYSSTLETYFLEDCLASAVSKLGSDYILDIDLDCFKTRKSIFPDDHECFYRLIRGARAVTVSMERDWVRLLNMDFDRSLDAEFYHARLLEHIEKALA